MIANENDTGDLRSAAGDPLCDASDLPAVDGQRVGTGTEGTGWFSLSGVYAQRRECRADIHRSGLIPVVDTRPQFRDRLDANEGDCRAGVSDGTAANLAFMSRETVLTGCLLCTSVPRFACIAAAERDLPVGRPRSDCRLLGCADIFDERASDRPVFLDVPGTAADDTHTDYRCPGAVTLLLVGDNSKSARPEVKGVTLVTVEGRDVLFVHWPVETDSLAPLIPDSLELDTYDGTAWVSALAHRVVGVRPSGSPRSLRRSFPQLNVRTYVNHADESGVYFLNCETGDRLGALIAREGFGIPFYHTEADFTEQGDEYVFRSRREREGEAPVRFDARYRPTGEPTPADPESLTDFCVERSRWFVVDDGIRSGTVERDPWRVGPVEADVRTTSLLTVLGIETAGESRVEYSPGYEMGATRLRQPESQTGSRRTP